jgi:hypothetical protein
LAIWSIAAGKTVGTTRFIGLEPWDWWLCVEEGERRQRHGRPHVVESGATWPAPTAQ